MAGDSFEHLVEIMAKLRGPQGCPWDKEQTPKTLKPYLIEEAYEVTSALEEKDQERLKEELGDLLLQVVFQAQIASEKKNFTIREVIETLIEKLIRRHPHVFGEKKLETSSEVLTHWEEIKEKEKKAPLLSGISPTLPALLYSYLLQKKAANVGFDWPRSQDILAKLKEELNELAQTSSKEALEEEVGDVFFTLVNLSRHLKILPEIALHKVAQKFRRRFEYIENKAKRFGKDLKKMSLGEMDELWEEAKQNLK